MLKMARDGIEPVQPGSVGPLKQIEAVKAKELPGRLRRRRGRHRFLAQIRHQLGAVVLRRRHSVRAEQACRRLLLRHQDRTDLLQHHGRCRRPADRVRLHQPGYWATVIDVAPHEGKVVRHDSGEVVTTFELKTSVLLDEVRAGGRIPADRRPWLDIEKPAPSWAWAPLTCSASRKHRPIAARASPWRRKWSACACGLPEGRGVRPGTYCEPKMTTVGSQDTTGPMTRDELEGPRLPRLLRRPGDAVLLPHRGLSEADRSTSRPTTPCPTSSMTRGGVSLRPGDGIIHSWLNRMLLPDTVGTGGDSHTRFPIGISVPGRLRPGGLRRRHRRDAAGHAGVGAGAASSEAGNRASPCVT